MQWNSGAIPGIWMFNATAASLHHPPEEHYLLSQAPVLILPAACFQHFQFAISNVNLSFNMKSLSGELPIGELVQHIPFFFRNYYFLSRKKIVVSSN